MKEKIFLPTKFIRTSWRTKKVNITNDYNSFRCEWVICDNNTVKSHHVNWSDFFKKTWLSWLSWSRSSLKKILFICNKVYKDLKVNKTRETSAMTIKVSDANELTSHKLYWIEDQLADVSTRFYTLASWRWRVEPSTSWLDTLEIPALI